MTTKKFSSLAEYMKWWRSKEGARKRSTRSEPTQSRYYKLGQRIAAAACKKAEKKIKEQEKNRYGQLR